jgi:hypothetical protein
LCQNTRRLLAETFLLDIFFVLTHKGLAAIAATRGDLGQLAPRKKLLKSFSEFPEIF